MCSGLPQIKV